MLWDARLRKRPPLLGLDRTQQAEDEVPVGTDIPNGADMSSARLAGSLNEIDYFLLEYLGEDQNGSLHSRDP